MIQIAVRLDDYYEEKHKRLLEYFSELEGRDLNNRDIVEKALDLLHEHTFDADVVAASEQNMKDLIFNEMTNLLGTTFTSFFQLLDEIRTRLNLVDSKLDLDIQKSFETYEVIELMMRMMFMPDPLTKQIMRPANASEVDRALSTDYIATSRTRESAKLKYEKAMRINKWESD